jgi:hypothetical protein
MFMTRPYTRLTERQLKEKSPYTTASIIDDPIAAIAPLLIIFYLGPCAEWVESHRS